VSTQIGRDHLRHTNHLVILGGDHLIGLNQLRVLLLHLRQLLNRFPEMCGINDDVTEAQIGEGSRGNASAGTMRTMISRAFVSFIFGCSLLTD
jgi:hypothetical protein